MLGDLVSWAMISLILIAFLNPYHTNHEKKKRHLFPSFQISICFPPINDQHTTVKKPFTPLRLNSMGRTKSHIEYPCLNMFMENWICFLG